MFELPPQLRPNLLHSESAASLLQAALEAVDE